MKECSLDLIFFLLETDHLFLWLVGGGGGGAGADFFQQLKLDFYSQLKYFLCLQLLLGPIHLLNFSFIK